MTTAERKLSTQMLVALFNTLIVSDSKPYDEGDTVQRHTMGLYISEVLMLKRTRTTTAFLLACDNMIRDLMTEEERRQFDGTVARVMEAWRASKTPSPVSKQIATTINTNCVAT